MEKLLLYTTDYEDATYIKWFLILYESLKSGNGLNLIEVWILGKVKCTKKK